MLILKFFGKNLRCTQKKVRKKQTIKSTKKNAKSAKAAPRQKSRKKKCYRVRYFKEIFIFMRYKYM